MAKISTDNHIRSMLDPVHPSSLQPAFDQAITLLRANPTVAEKIELMIRENSGLLAERILDTDPGED